MGQDNSLCLRPAHKLLQSRDDPRPAQQGHKQCDRTATTPAIPHPENMCLCLLSVRGMGENNLCCGRAVSIPYLLSAAPGPSESCPGQSVPLPGCCAQSGSWEQPAARADGTVKPQSNIVPVTHCAAAHTHTPKKLTTHRRTRVRLSCPASHPCCAGPRAAPLSNTGSLSSRARLPTPPTFMQAEPHAFLGPTARGSHSPPEHPCRLPQPLPACPAPGTPHHCCTAPARHIRKQDTHEGPSTHNSHRSTSSTRKGHRKPFKQAGLHGKPSLAHANVRLNPGLVSDTHTHTRARMTQATTRTCAWCGASASVSL